MQEGVLFRLEKVFLDGPDGQVRFWGGKGLPTSVL